jgi:very-short-patch-repair endonuclease
MKRSDPKARPRTSKPRLHTAPDASWIKLRPLARQMRHMPTEAEGRLWGAVRRGALGMKFRRQHAIDRYIVDFLCAEAGLIVEVDGAAHLNQADYDAARDQHLRACGYRILRFKNEEVLERLDEVVAAIRAALQPPTAAP